MGRRKIEIKAIKDDRNRSVTFLKRKGGLFKKAHELSVLCSVDVAVFIFGSNKKLYEYSSCDMRDLITRYTYHGGPNEHKGPSDFNNGGADEEEEDDENGTPPQVDGMDSQMLPPHFQTQPFPHIRHQTPSASPPIPNGMFGPHPGAPRGHTPQPPQLGSRPSSRNDIRRMGPNMVGGPVGPQGPPPPGVNGFAFMPQPAIYNPNQNMPPNGSHHGMPQPHAQPPPHPQYPYPPPQPHPQMQPFVEDHRRSSVPPNFPPQVQAPPPPRHSVSPPQPVPPQLPQQPVQHMMPSPPQPQLPMQSPPLPQQPSQQQQHVLPPPPQELPQIRPPNHEPQPPAPVERKPDLVDRPRQPPLLDTVIKKQPPRKGGSIFTPIDENRSILSQHLAAFNAESKSETPASRSHSLDMGRARNTNSPPSLQRASTQGQPPQIKRNGSLSSIPETIFTPPSRSNSMRVGSVSRPRLKVQIPDESDGGSATAESASPRGTTTTTEATTQPARSSVVLPPPSPSASALLSAGASGPPNPFARPPPHQNNNNNSMNIDTPVSALPSRFLNNEFLPSPSSFYPDWNFRNDSNTLPSPLNFATPIVGTGPSFLRDDPISTHKRKSPDMGGNAQNGGGPEPLEMGDSKRVKVDS
ncbi:putative MADS-box MEF2 type transcription factor [Cladorrhinum sp. PSN332]|nr:putative MADS-box MEF2 type transcription factor [Cladorrhinum sp. PSN332]